MGKEIHTEMETRQETPSMIDPKMVAVERIKSSTKWFCGKECTLSNDHSKASKANTPRNWQKLTK